LIFDRRQIKSEDMKAKHKAFDENVNKVLGEAYNPDDFKDDPDMSDLDTPTYDRYEDDDEGAYSQVPEFDDVSPDTYNCYVSSEVELPIGDKVMSGKVKRRKREHVGSLKGTEHPDPMLDIHMCEVELPDRQVAEYSANVIAENMYTQCNAEGNPYLLLDEICNWRRDNNATDARDDMYVYSHNNNQQYQKTMKGWKLCAKWKDGMTSWHQLAGLKDSYPIEVAEFAVTQGIHDEPAFIWWVPYVLAKHK
jgi:hypothetical protein